MLDKRCRNVDAEVSACTSIRRRGGCKNKQMWQNIGGERITEENESEV
jgi:hypothetical protein